MSKTSELLQAIKNKSIPTRSELNLRNKNKQTRLKLAKLSYLKKEKDKTAKLLFPTEFVAYLNPLTMEEDETYNSETAFRTEKTFTSTALAIKANCNENPEVKAKMLEYVGEDSWDTSNAETFTAEDRIIFKSFREIRMFTNDMVKIKLPTLTKKPFACDYLANYTRDKFGKVETADGDYPQILRIQQFYRSIALEEYNEWEEKNKAKNDSDKREQYRAVMSTCPIQPDIPVNVALGIEIPVTNAWDPLKPLKTMTADDVKKSLVLIRMTKDMRDLLESILSKFTTSDLDPDFLEMDMIVGDEDDDQERGKNTKYQLASRSIARKFNDDGASLVEDYNVFKNSFLEVMDGFENLDATMKKATTYNVIDDALTESVYAALEIDKPLASIERFITSEIAEKMGDIIDQVYGGNADEVLVKASVGELKDSTVSEQDLALAESNIRDILKEQEEIGDFSSDLDE